MTYTDKDGSYQLLLGRDNEPYISTNGPDESIAYTDSVPHGYCPEAMAVSFVDFLGRDNVAERTWTIAMKGGDVIILHQTMKVWVIQTVDNYPEDALVGTMEELQALIDEISDIDFVGRGRGNVGITAARVHLTGCAFTGCRSAVLPHRDFCLNFRYCEFTDNEVGFHFNTSQSNVIRSQFDGNRFTENGTAILWEGTPVDMAISFLESVFTHNGTDIDNRSGQSIDISRAVFEQRQAMATKPPQASYRLQRFGLSGASRTHGLDIPKNTENFFITFFGHL